MANEQNLIPNSMRSPTEVRENGRKGGINSGKARREKKTVQKILEDYLSKKVKSNKNLKELAKSVGIKESQSIKELMAAVCIINTLKKGDIEKLKALCDILGEDNGFSEIEDMSEAEGEIFGND